MGKPVGSNPCSALLWTDYEEYLAMEHEEHGGEGSQMDTVMSGASYSTLEGQKYGSVVVTWNWLQLMCCTYL